MLMNKYQIVILILLIPYVENTFADSVDVMPMRNINKFLNRIEKESENTLSISSDFIQKKHLSFISNDVISKGKLYFKKDNLLRWEYYKPYKYIMVLNGGKIFIKDNDQVSSFDIHSSKMFTEINDIMLSAITGEIFKDKTKFTPAFFETNNEYKVKLNVISGDMKKYLEKIVLYFSKHDYSLTRLQMIESNNDATDIIFLNRILNNEIPDKIFNID